VSKERVAIKIPFDDILLNPLYAACLRAEMRIIERAGPHDNLISVMGEEGDALILKAFEGENMEDMIERSAPFSERDLLPLFSQLCELLAHLHNMGIVHHDVRPQNFMVTEDGTIKLFDLGYAFFREIPDPIFESGMGPQGDFRYMAPEQMTGKRGDPRSDIYTLGVLLYQMCTGRLPFEKTRSTLKAWLRIKETIKPPDTVRGQLPKEMTAIILKAMAWDMDTRYQWVEDLREDVESL
jgi:serine/threonine protein kinase